MFCDVKQWRDALLQWNASEYDNVHQVVLQPRQIWTPDVVLINAYVSHYFHSCNTTRVYSSIIQPFVHCRLDYCNSALADRVAKVYLQKFQSVQNMAARMVSGVRRSEHITPVVENLLWLPVSQRMMVFKTALMVWKCVHGVASAYLSDLCVPAILRSSASAICSDWHSTGSTHPDCNWTTKFRSQRTSHMSATSTMVTGPVGERLQAGTEDAPVLDCPAPLRRFHDSGAGYKHPDFLT